MTELLWALFFTPWSYARWGAPTLFWGPPGIGKSSAFRAFSQSCGLAERLEILSAALRGEGAFGCVPVPAEGRLTYPPPDWAARLDGVRGREALALVNRSPGVHIEGKKSPAGEGRP